MKKILDKGLNVLRNNKLLDFFKRSENWVERIGLMCLYFVFPILGIVFCVKYAKGLHAMLGSATGVAIAFVVISILGGYIADKMLGYVKPSIDQAKTNIVNGALFDVLAFVFGIVALASGVMTIYDICTGAFVGGFTALVVFALSLYCAVLLLSPAKMLNVHVQESATPAQSLIAILSLLVKASYRLVPFAFGAVVILCLVNGISMTFVGKIVYHARLFNFVYMFIVAALLPLIGYLMFLAYYFVLDLCLSLFRIADAVEGKNKAK